jgi:hypothetical protein
MKSHYTVEALKLEFENLTRLADATRSNWIRVRKNKTKEKREGKAHGVIFLMLLP